jgi:hypothetical protein
MFESDEKISRQCRGCAAEIEACFLRRDQMVGFAPIKPCNADKRIDHRPV